MTDLLPVASPADTTALGRPAKPHAGPLVDLVVPAARAAELRELSVTWPNWRLSRRQLCDLELLAGGGFSPLRGFLGEADYGSVCQTMRLADGRLWPIPITLDLPDAVLRATETKPLALRDTQGVMLAALHVDEAWRPDRVSEAAAVFGTTDPLHPGVEHVLRSTHDWYVTGRLEVLQMPEHDNFADLRHTPRELRADFARRGWTRIVAFQTRNPMHRAHHELTLQAVRAADAKLLIHPVVGITKPGDVDYRTRVRCYRALLASYPADTAMLSLLPLAMRMAGPREALWHALVRQNFGATHFIVGRDHAGPGADSSGRPFYGRYAAQQLVARHQAELGVQVLPFGQMCYVEGAGGYLTEEDVPAGARIATISGTELRRRLVEGRELPAWFTPPEVAAELRRAFPPRAEQGFTVFFTGLSGAGKSTIASALCAALQERAGRHVTLLDGDVVREHLSSELTFSRADRDRNVRRIGFVAAEVTKSGGIAICAPIAPYDAARRDVRRMVGVGGGFVLVHVRTPIGICERRDRKGLYAKARLGLLPDFTGVTDPYEEPTDADLVVDGHGTSPQTVAVRIVDFLEERGYLQPGGRRPHGVAPEP
jgi:sulfate adenylyltransferase